MAEQNLNSRLAAAPRESQMIDISSAIIYSKRQRRSLGSVAISSGPLAGDNLDWLGSLTSGHGQPAQVPHLLFFVAYSALSPYSFLGNLTDKQTRPEKLCFPFHHNSLQSTVITSFDILGLESDVCDVSHTTSAI